MSWYTRWGCSWQWCCQGSKRAKPADECVTEADIWEALDNLSHESVYRTALEMSQTLVELEAPALALLRKLAREHGYSPSHAHAELRRRELNIWIYVNDNSVRAFVGSSDDYEYALESRCGYTSMADNERAIQRIEF